MKPHVIIHCQVSADGRIDWFPIDPGLYYEITSQWNEDVTLAGTNTLLTAVDQFGDATVEQDKSIADDNSPLLVVPDSRGRFKHWEVLLSTPYWRGGLALCTKITPQSHLEYLKEIGVESILVGDDQVDLPTALSRLADIYGVKIVRVDSGGILNGALLRNGLVDEVSVLISPYLVGGVTPKSLFQAPDLTDASGMIGLLLTSIEKLRDDVVWLRYTVKHPEETT
jgi:2,5-diamino-6-(ribosylamino)-4(3H)-pyrimidinone 5'-phosphate reductase